MSSLIPPLDTTVDLTTLFAAQVQRTPDLIALHDPSPPFSSPFPPTLTYAALEHHTARLAAWLRTLGVRRDSLVGLLLPRSAAYVVGALAAMRAGGAFLVLEMAYPPSLLADVLVNAAPTVVLTLAELASSIASDVPVIVMDQATSDRADVEFATLNSPASLSESPLNVDTLLETPAASDISRLAFVTYSSGTTGKPKGIANPHSAPVRSYALRFGLSDLAPGDRVACNVFFVWEILRPLLRGATVITVPDAVSYDPAELVNLLEREEVTETLMTPTLLAAVLARHDEGGKLSEKNDRLGDHEPSPKAVLAQRLARLKTLWFNGEVVTVDLARRAQRALPNTRLCNCYSISETHEVACDDLSAYLNTLVEPPPGGESLPFACPVGLSVDPAHTYVLDPETLRPVAAGEKGELFVGGALLARGYINLPESTAEAFLPDPFNATDAHARMFRTGDLARVMPSGALEITGRVGGMIKLRGYSVQPGKVEAAVTTALRVRDCAVVAAGEGLDKVLVAYVVPESDENRDMNGGDVSGNEDRPPVDIATSGYSPSARRVLSSHLAPYMLPTLWVALPQLPTHPVSGKVDLGALPPPPTVTSLAATAATYAPDQPYAPANNVQRTDDGSAIVAMWAATLNVPADIMTDEHTFFDLGGHSLTLASLAGRMGSHFGLTIPLGRLAEAPTLAGHEAIVNDIRDGSHNEGDLGRAQAVRDELAALMAADSVLAEDIRPDGPVRYTPLNEARSVLLTGATGFLGAFILHELVQRTRSRIICLVRFSEPSSQCRPAAMARLRKQLVELGLWTDKLPSRVSVLPGDLSHPLFGLGEVGFEELAGQVDVIIHAAATVNLVYPYAALRGANIRGAGEMLRFACRAGATLHHISTNGVLPAGEWAEDSGLDTPMQAAEKIRDGYGQTKWVAERLVLEAARRGLPTRVYRPGTICGHSETGAANPYDMLGAVMVEALNMGLAPAAERLWIETTPVDYVAGAILALATHEDDRIVFHLGDPRPMRSEDVFAIFAGLGYPTETVAWADWLTNWKQTRGAISKAGDDVFTVEVLRGGLDSVDDLLRVPILKDNDTAAVLNSLGVVRPAADVSHFATYALHFYARGWLPHPPTVLPVSPLSPAERVVPTLSAPPTGPLSGKVCLVTGSSSGIGAATALMLASQGAHVCLAARRTEQLDDVRARILALGVPEKVVLARATDVTDPGAVASLVEETETALGPVDIVVVCAGVMYYTMMDKACLSEWQTTVAVNCNGLLNVLASLVPRMISRRSGHVVAISSDAGRKVFPGLGIYSASKFFVEATLQALRAETAETGLRVTSVQPGNVDTGLVNMSTDAEAVAKYSGEEEMRKGEERWLRPEEVADAIIWAVTRGEDVGVNEVLIEPRVQPI